MSQSVQTSLPPPITNTFIISLTLTRLKFLSFGFICFIWFFLLFVFFNCAYVSWPWGFRKALTNKVRLLFMGVKCGHLSARIGWVKDLKAVSATNNLFLHIETQAWTYVSHESWPTTDTSNCSSAVRSEPTVGCQFLPPIRAESLLMALTNGWPGSTESGWSVRMSEMQKHVERSETKQIKIKGIWIHLELEKCAVRVWEESFCADISCSDTQFTTVVKLICCVAIILSVYWRWWLMIPVKSGRDRSLPDKEFGVSAV